MYRVIFVLLATLWFFPTANADNGLITLKSPYSVDQTLDRFEEAVKKKGMTIFSRIDHTAGAKKVDLDLRPTKVLIFGNPKIGTLLMQSNQTAAIDLPLKLLAWEDESGQVWIAYNDPAYLAKRHAITDRAPVVAKMRTALGNFTAAATAK
jgi:uncharacterized protein (DUF302 family)